MATLLLCCTHSLTDSGINIGINSPAQAHAYFLPYNETCIYSGVYGLRTSSGARTLYGRCTTTYPSPCVPIVKSLGLSTTYYKGARPGTVPSFGIYNAKANYKDLSLAALSTCRGN